MSAQPARIIPTPSSERARSMLDRARAERNVAREQRRFMRQVHAHAADLLRPAPPSGRERLRQRSAG